MEVVLGVVGFARTKYSQPSNNNCRTRPKTKKNGNVCWGSLAYYRGYFIMLSFIIGLFVELSLAPRMAFLLLFLGLPTTPGRDPNVAL